MGRGAMGKVTLGLLAACVALGLRLDPAVADTEKKTRSYSGICRSQCCDANRNCTISAAPWTGESGNRVTGAGQCTFEVQCDNKRGNLVKANSSFFFETGCWQDWVKYDSHNQLIPNSQFTLGCAPNQVSNASPADAPAMAILEGQLYDFFETNQSLSFVSSVDGANWSGPSALALPAPLNSPITATGQAAPLSTGSGLTIYHLSASLWAPPGTPMNCQPYPACTANWYTAYTVADFKLGPGNVVSRDDDRPPITVSVFQNAPQDRKLDGVSVVSFNGALIAAAAAGQGPAAGRLSIISPVDLYSPDRLASYPIDSIRSDGRPTMTVFQGQLWLAFGKAGKLQIMTSGDGRTFSGPTVAWDENNNELAISGDPSLAVFNGHLYVAYASGGGADHPLVFRTLMNVTRSHAVFPGYSQTYPAVTFQGKVAPAGPISLLPFGSGLQASFRGADGCLYVTVP